MKSDKTYLLRYIVLLGVICVLGILGFLWWKDGISAVNPQDSTPVNFVIRKGEGIKSIATRLSQENLIRSPTAFFVLIKLEGIEKQIQAGDFRLNRSLDARSVARELTHGFVDVWVTIPEGWRREEIAMKLSRELDIPETEFLKVAVEGYMFPDTYLIPRDASASAVVDIFKRNFDTKVTSEIRREIEGQGISFADAVVLASLIEREGKTDDDRPVIAGILLNRLRLKMPLQVDATLQYALGYQADSKSWWKKTLSADDKSNPSPYNTYINTGLPPEPIANPGLSAIRAVGKPAVSDYLYYIHDENGTIHYARTLEEHNANVASYLR
ncbi:hypothetical protein A2Z33_06830 [Candidatus Gottesmanbacteria bacterium RBG_16_52_11]|uniref:Endolytic murein transglycosylase n=1 Tax=Candidatus Gottesmanbacteria bacterium RBG_16_52_11 TaxID=1798374 RepID=A0A1F5YYD6_9BACT|nr:MAG: hypothetical protein A2Z33_06830 [Candidatus Gottesmanbacteria bacterium RBG_16_52_11]